MAEPIIHLANLDDWARSTDRHSPPGSEEGFIHCSTGKPLPRVAHELFADRNDLILLTIDPEALDDETLVFEDLNGLGEEFPHIHGPLPTSAVLATVPYLIISKKDCGGRQFDREWMERVLHPDVTEVGISGRVYSRAETLEAPPTELDEALPHQGPHWSSSTKPSRWSATSAS